MNDLKNWTEVTKGLYRYVVAAGCCYEIHIMYHAKETDILTANASLYIVGDWTTANGYCSYFERELLLNGPLMACLEKAVEDGKGMEAGICERWTTATQQTAHLNDAYIKGFHDGVRKEHDKIISILEREVNKDE